MVLEVAVLNIKAGMADRFEEDFKTASGIISSMQGFVSLELQRCVEKPDQYILLVNWENLESHTVGFRQSPQYQGWRHLLHHYYDPFPVVNHYEKIHAY